MSVIELPKRRTGVKKETYGDNRFRDKGHDSGKNTKGRLLNRVNRLWRTSHTAARHQRPWWEINI